MNIKKIYNSHFHAGPEKELSSVLKTGNMCSSWIFSGPSGIGKLLIAYKFIYFILSGEKPTFDRLDVNEIKSIDVIKMVDSSIHPDFFFIDHGSADVSMDVYRNIMQRIYQKPAFNGWRVFLVNSVEMANKNIFNSLLKLLEEPPIRTAIILITNNFNIIPDTLISRCFVVKFPRISGEFLEKTLTTLNIDNPKEIGYLSNGSIGNAIDLSKIKATEIYFKFLRVLCDESSESEKMEFYKEDFTNNWMLLKKMIIRVMNVFVSNSLNIDANFMKNELSFLSKFSINNEQKVIECFSEILDIMSQTETMMLDKKIFMQWLVDEKFAKLKAG